MSARANYKRTKKIGPGGIHCACCGPAPGKDRKKAKRAWKRSERRDALREAKKES